MYFDRIMLLILFPVQKFWHKIKIEHYRLNIETFAEFHWVVVIGLYFFEGMRVIK